jgi:hypothetical protein
VLSLPGDEINANRNYTKKISLEWLPTRTQTTNASEDAAKWGSLYTAGGNVTSTTTVESSMERP